MSACAKLLAYAMFALVLAHALGLFTPKPLPHRPVDALTNWGQGHAPIANQCPPGTIRFETDDNLFLECMRGTN
jgi:hypothetical protein